MKCDLCEGEYREKTVTRNYKWHGKITVIEDVPALVCDHCGDVLIREETIKAPAFFLPQVFLILRVYTVCSG